MRLISFAVLSTALICSVPAAAKTQSEQEQQTVGNPADKKVCRRLKNDVVTGPIPVLQKTAVYGDPVHRQQGLASGADE